VKIRRSDPEIDRQGAGVWAEPSEEWLAERRIDSGGLSWLAGLVAGAPLVLLVVGVLVHALSFALLAIVGMSGVGIYIAERARFAYIAHRSPAVEAPSSAEFLVRVVIEVDGVAMGSDIGVVWFEPGVMWFSGERTWFRIASTHLRNMDGSYRRAQWYFELPHDRPMLYLSPENKRVRIRLDASRTSQANAVARLKDELTAFVRDRTNSSASSQLPPLELDPHYRHDVWRDTELASGSGCLIAASACLAVLGLYVGGGAMAAVFLSICLAAATVPPALRISRASLIRRHKRSALQARRLES
jgi:hypothetical protein